MTERPILFSGDMVRAILSGTKTQTRRIVKRQPADGCYYVINGAQSAACHLALHDGPNRYVPPTPTSKTHLLPCPYGQPQTVLWVRETFCQLRPEHIDPGESGIVYAEKLRSNESVRSYNESERCREELGYKWKPSIFMPRSAARILLEIEAIRVERLHEITEADALAEGVTPYHRPTQSTERGDPITQNGYAHDARMSYSRLWDKINGKKAAWITNPFVWVLTFQRLK